MMNRPAQLAIAATECLAFEALSDFKPDAARAATRDVLRDVAIDLGYPADAIETEIDRVLEGR